MSTTLASALDQQIMRTGEEGSFQLAGSFASKEDFLEGVAQVAPFLGRLVSRSPDRLERVMAANVEDGLDAIFPRSDEVGPVDEIKRHLRNCRKDIALGLALGDLAGVLSMEDVTARLSEFADISLSIALNTAWSEILSRYYQETPESGGLSLIGMGKLGAGELNYSSDIDIIAIYDPERVPLPENEAFDAKGICVKLVRRIVDILNEQTSDGFVFRTDLRLRPNPSATPVAVSLSSAEHYYQVSGQNWERAAFIKARHCAGDKQVGASFLESMRPFVWRRTLDYGAVADIYAVKNQIHAEKGSPDILVRGGNIKLGPGGIREIEFFAQMQQLLLGGRDKELRSPRTIEALKALENAGHVDGDTCDQLISAYTCFRNLEHRLQMREDEQTHDIPEDDTSFGLLTRGMGFDNARSFENVTLSHLRNVHDAYADLFGAPEAGSEIKGSLVFTGVDDDPRTLSTLAKLGFEEPALVTSRVRNWHQGGLRATASVRARELLTVLVPHILYQIGKLSDPDRAFRALDFFLSELPRGFQVFSLFNAEPKILNDVLALCEASPDLVRRLGQQPALVEGLIDGMDVAPVPIPPLPDGAGLEDHLDEVRRVVNEHRVRVSAGIILGLSNPLDCGPALATMADAAINHLVAEVIGEMPFDYREIGAGLAIVAFGRLGAKSLTPASDLDLVFVYKADPENRAGEVYFTRLIRRIVSSLSVPTSEGELFEIDMKLRPSGGAGPTAVSLATFKKYYSETAWIWEEMALTKARVVFGDASLTEEITSVITATIRKERDEEEVQFAVYDMLQRLKKEKPARSNLDIKRRIGGLTDMEFIVQFLTLVHGSKLNNLKTTFLESVNELELVDGLSAAHAEVLRNAHVKTEILIQFLRAIAGAVPPSSLSELQEQKILRAFNLNSDETNLPDFLSQQCAEVEKLVEHYLSAKNSD